MQAKYLAVIPFYHGKLDSIIRTCELLREYSFVVILYDNSNSISKSYFHRVGNLIIARPETNEGVYGAYNYAFSAISKTNFTHLLLLDQDSLMSHSFLEACTALMSSDISHHCVLAPFDNCNLIKTKSTGVSNHLIHSQLLDAKGSGLILPKDLCIPKLLDPCLYLDYLDWSFCWKLRSLGFSIYHIKIPLAFHSLGSQFTLRLLYSISFRISSPSRILNQLRSSLYLLLSPQYYGIMPIPRRLKLSIRILCIPFLLLISVLLHHLVESTNDHG